MPEAKCRKVVSVQLHLPLGSRIGTLSLVAENDDLVAAVVEASTAMRFTISKELRCRLRSTLKISLPLRNQIRWNQLNRKDRENVE